MNNTSLVVHTCDKYSFLWESFFYYFNKHVECSFDKYFCTENKDVQNIKEKGFNLIKTGKGEWSDRLRSVLSGLDTKYVFYMQEDIWPYFEESSKVKKIHLNNYYETLLNKYNLKCLHVQPMCRYYKCTDSGNVKIFKNESPYLMNHKPGLWDREFFIHFLGRKENPWTNEKKATKRMSSMNLGSKIGLVENEWYEDVCHKGELIQKGEYLNENRKKLQKV